MTQNGQIVEQRREWPAPIQRLEQAFARLDADSLGGLDAVYATNVEFLDPVRRVQGLAGFKDYLARLYDRIAWSEVTFDQVLWREESAAVFWHMRLAPRSGGEPWEIPGASYVRFTDRINFHRDYFDLGRLVYERIPLLGHAVRAVKRFL